jgi:hypothetical protein
MSLGSLVAESLIRSRPGRGDLPRHPGELLCIAIGPSFERDGERFKLAASGNGVELCHLVYCVAGQGCPTGFSGPYVQLCKDDDCRRTIPPVRFAESACRRCCERFRSIQTAEVRLNPRRVEILVCALVHIARMLALLCGGERRASLFRFIHEGIGGRRADVQSRTNGRYPWIISTKGRGLRLSRLKTLEREPPELKCLERIVRVPASHQSSPGMPGRVADPIGVSRFAPK